MQQRCPWCGIDPLYQAYHDQEWGVPVHDDQRLFELLVLEGAQAGLSWLTILRKREAYRRVFKGFEIETVARFGKDERMRLLAESGIVRNRLKIDAAIKNARAVLALQEHYDSLDAFLWRYVDGMPIHNSWQLLSEVPASTALSEQMSKDLKRQGFSFVGPTICYSFMQAVGMVNDHLTSCFRHQELVRLGREGDEKVSGGGRSLIKRGRKQ